MTKWMTVAAGLALAACSGQAPSGNQAASDATIGNDAVSLRNLTDSAVATIPASRDFTVKGTLVPTPSDTRSRHYLLRERRAMGGTVVALLREERGDRVAYARTEIDCGKRLFHIMGVGPSRAAAELHSVTDGPLRSMDGLPLRVELGSFICARAGTPLAGA